MSDLLKVFIGYDSREPVAYHVAAHSILARASAPVAIIPLDQRALRLQGSYWRAPDQAASTEFSLTRFLVPYLSGYEGASVFMDCDMLVQDDIYQVLVDCANARPINRDRPWAYAVWVCQHDYTPKEGAKMDGQVQHAYPRKNWSSFTVFDNAKCRSLTPAYVNSATPAQLHRFAWLGDSEIGELPLDWNWLVGEYEPNATARILHYTLGGPWFRHSRNCDHADLWRAEYDRMTAPAVEHGHVLPKAYAMVSA